MWPATIETIRIVRPKFAFLENVPGLLSSKSGVDEITGRPISYCATIFRDLAEAGYDARWTVLGADNIGANHRRMRFWLFAYSTSIGLNTGDKRSEKKRKLLENNIKSTDRRTGKTCGSNNGNLWFKDELDILRMDDDDSHRVDRLKAIGNGQVPQCAATAWEILKP